MIGQKPTIEELEKILQEPNPNIEIAPDGTVTTTDFRKELESLLNKHNREGKSSTPDFILAEFLIGCLYVFDASIVKRARWYGRTAGNNDLEK